MFSSNLRAALYLAGRIAERRGRRFKNWAWIAAFIGPLALPLLFPNLRDQNRDHGWGSKQGGPGHSVPALCFVDDRGRRLRRPYSAACLRVLAVGYTQCNKRGIPKRKPGENVTGLNLSNFDFRYFSRAA
jgi:hypothetical protein